MFPESQRYANGAVSKAIKLIKLMSADMGGNEIYEPLNNLLIKNPIKGYPR